MKKENFILEAENANLEVEDALHLVSAFESWFDKNFKSNDLDRHFDPNTAADLWAECPDFAAVLDAAVCALLKANRALDKLSEGGVEE